MDITHLFYFSAWMLGAAAVLGWANVLWFKLPHAIAMVLLALGISLSLIALDAVFGFDAVNLLRDYVEQVQFNETLMIGMLSFLLFAGALHTDVTLLLKYKWPVLAMATLGVVLSTFIVGYASHAMLVLLGFKISLPWCLVFGALISPTDPVAVLSILKKVDLSPELEVKIAGESLFNDGIGVVVFMLMLSVANAPGVDVGFAQIASLLLTEVVGGVLIGLAGGYVAFFAMRSIDEYSVEILITLALVTIIYSAALLLHASGPLAVVVAGLIIGGHGKRHAMSAKTRDHLQIFWTVLDDILNSVLFLLIGVEVLALGFSGYSLIAIALTVPLVLIARAVSVYLPMKLTHLRKPFARGEIRILTWAGLRGGISIALALSLPAFAGRGTLIVITYGVVLCSILLQGLSIEKLSRRWAAPPV